jgi:hypothetical protein
LLCVSMFRDFEGCSPEISLLSVVKMGINSTNS